MVGQHYLKPSNSFSNRNLGLSRVRPVLTWATIAGFDTSLLTLPQAFMELMPLRAEPIKSLEWWIKLLST